MNWKTFLSPLLVAGLLASFSGCGGGADDPTSVALKPNKEEAKGGGASTNGGNGGNNTSSGGGGEDGGKVGYGKIKGRIVLADGDPIPTLPPLFAVGTATVNKEYCAKDMPIDNQSLVVNSDNRGVKNVFIYLVEKPDRAKPKAASQMLWPTAGEPGTLVLDQNNCTFIPHAMLIPVGVPFTGKSQDAVVHSIKGTPAKSSAFNFTVDPTNKSGVEQTYPRAETKPVSIGCATHNWMQAWQLPLDHPYAAVTNENGEFEISDLPSGDHEFVIWHELKKELRTNYAVTVTADEDKDLGNISFGLSELK